ncbi:hypothetical protein C8N32_11625 [Rhodovulum imhoffii]|uniref:Tetratricopeptide repeat-like domain-containing protein n=1 Tax=Rhodovulum imhoffii TaxID=365340 RepID=A0A2T5BPY7_9RHOB|nr:hypothetical protein [Rhodovulum imhoffii]MBK5933097.1 hypothetical protein [Rhodovulum imhoffii]PTN01152.1 hypothetical protein C8N32_11625 [Rhodovulum imhoffii]
MSNPDSFIEEVTQEVRRDRLFALFRRYGWIGILLVVALVGGAAYNEWRKAGDTAQAQAFGNALGAALQSADPVAALTAVQPPPDGAALKVLLLAGEQAGAGEEDSARATLSALAQDMGVPEVYRHLASLKQVLLMDGTPPQDRRALLAPLARPGAPFRLLAEEQLALIDIETGDAGAARTRLEALAQDAEATAGLRQRAAQLMLALGQAPDAR